MEKFISVSTEPRRDKKYIRICIYAEISKLPLYEPYHNGHMLARYKLAILSGFSGVANLKSEHLISTNSLAVTC